MRIAGEGRIHAVALLFFALLFFARSFPSYFVSDDFQFLGRVDFSNAGEYFTRSWGYGSEFRPLLPYSYALDAYLSGENPVGYHLTSTMLHWVSAVLVASLALMAGLPRAGALLSGWVFLLNPVTHETVLWISARTVALSVPLILGSCWFFVRAARSQRPSRWTWVGAYAAFLTALGVYELAIVTPLLVGLLSVLAAKDRRRYAPHLIAFLAIACVYGLFWNWFFEFTIMRPLEPTAGGMLDSLGVAFTRAFHGSPRLDVLPFYLGLLAWLLAGRRGRILVLVGMAWFLASYLPYFAIEGHADRFAYLGSAAVAVILSAALTQVTSRWRVPGVALTLLLLAFFAVGMQNKITEWKQAGEIARAIPRQVKEILPEFPEDQQVVLLNVPQTHRRAYVFRTSLEQALERQYPGRSVHVATVIEPTFNGDAVVLEYSGGRMVRRNPLDFIPGGKPAPIEHGLPPGSPLTPRADPPPLRSAG